MVVITSPKCDKLIGIVTDQEVRSSRLPATNIFTNLGNSFDILDTE